MQTFAFYDTKPYDKIWFDKLKNEFHMDFKYFESKLNADTARLAAGMVGVVAFVNDTLDGDTIDALYEVGVRVVALRCSGYNNVDFQRAYGKIHVLRVPAYSPYAVAEYAMALLLTLNRKVHRAYIRTKEHNFSIDGLTGFDLKGKTVGVVGTGKIGQIFIRICQGFGMRVLAYDPYPIKDADFTYTDLDSLCREADILSLHCPLTRETHHIIDKSALQKMKQGAVIINTSRGALVDSEALLESIKERHIGGAALDVYEEETDLFFEDFSNSVILDDVLARLISMPNVIVTSHQAFLTQEALENIARTTLTNLRAFLDDEPLKNEICYQCLQNKKCDKSHKKRCF